jgi:hypothetical protein
MVKEGKKRDRNDPLARTGTNAEKGRLEAWGFPCKQCNTSLSTAGGLTFYWLTKASFTGGKMA